MSVEAEKVKSSAAIIQDRIAARRLYEARFLFRQLADELSPASREQLGTMLEDTIHGLEQKHRDAMYFAGQEKHDQAMELLREIELATIDFPDLEREKQRLSPVDPILESLNRDKPVAGKSERIKQKAPVAQPGRRKMAVQQQAPQSRKPGKPSRALTQIVLSLPVILAVIVLFLLLQR